MYCASASAAEAEPNPHERSEVHAGREQPHRSLQVGLGGHVGLSILDGLLRFRDADASCGLARLDRQALRPARLGIEATHLVARSNRGFRVRLGIAQIALSAGGCRMSGTATGFGYCLRLMRALSCAVEGNSCGGGSQRPRAECS
jgi:hypothetical protein